MASAGEKTLTLEMIGLMTITTLEGLGSGEMPGPSAYVGSLIVFGMLSVLAWSDRTSRLAAGLGGLVILGALLNPTTDANGGKTVAGSTLFGTLGRLVGAIGKAPHTTSPGIGGTPAPQVKDPQTGQWYDPRNERPSRPPGTPPVVPSAAAPAAPDTTNI